MGSEKESYQVFDNFLFPKIFQTYRMAIQPSKLIIAFLAVVIICLAGWIMDSCGETVVATSDTPDQLRLYIENCAQNGDAKGVFATLWHFCSARFHGAIDSLFVLEFIAVKANIADFSKALAWTVRHHYIYCAIFFVIGLAVISVAGGAVCRISALQFARGEKPGLTEALRYSIRKFMSFFSTPLAPAGIIIFIALFIFLLGLIGNIPRAGELIMGIFMLLALIAGALIAIILIGTVAGFNLMFPAIVYEDSDCFDAISRSFSYVYSKPWHMGLYTVIAAVYGAICYMFMRFFTFLLLWATYRFLQLGLWADNSKLTAIWPEPSFTNLLGSSALPAANWSESIAAFLVYLLLLAVIGVLVSFIISFYFSANSIIYSLMRNRVDSTALDDIYTPSPEAKTEQSITESKSEESQPQPELEAQTD